MKITVRINELKRLLEEARFVVPKDPQIPVLANVKVEVDDAKRATISASDLGLSLTQSFEVVDGDAGSLLLPAKQVQDFLKGHVDGTATIETDEAHLTVRVRTFALRVAKENVLQFPAIEAMPKVLFTISLKFLNRLLTQVESAAPDKTGEHSVATVQLVSNASMLRAVASDGFRIAIADQPSAGAGDFVIQLPKVGLPILKRRKGTTFEFAQSETNMFFRTESTVFQIRIPTTKFPLYQKVLDLDAFKGTARVSSAELKLAILNLRSALALKEPNVLFEVGSGNVQLTALTKDGREIMAAGTGTLEVETEGEPGTFKLNSNFVLDVLSALEGEVEIRFINDRRLVLFKSGNVRHFIMPILLDKPKTEVAPQESPSTVNA